MTNCEEVLHFLDPLLDNELSVDESARVLLHLDSCIACQSQWQELSQLRANIHETVKAIKLPTKFEENLRKSVSENSQKYSNMKQGIFVIASTMTAAACFLGFIFITPPKTTPPIASEPPLQTTISASSALSSSDIIKEESRHSSTANASPQHTAPAEVQLVGWTLIGHEDCAMGEKIATRFSFTKDDNSEQKLSLYQMRHGQFNAKGMDEHNIDGRKICCGELGKTR